MSTTNTDELSRRIRQVIQEHLAACERAATEALAQAFGATSRVRRGGGGVPKATGDAKRRQSSEMSALGDRLYQAVCAKPGETMQVLAADVGSTPRLLNRPMTALKRQGRLRSVGLRHLTRYYPLSTKS